MSAAPNSSMLKTRPKTRSGKYGYGYTGDLTIHAQKPACNKSTPGARFGADPRTTQGKRGDVRSASFRSHVDRSATSPSSLNAQMPEPATYTLKTPFDVAHSAVSSAAFLDCSLRQGVVIHRDAKNMPEPGAYVPDIIRVAHGSGANRHPGDPSGMAFRPSSSYSNFGLDRFGEKLEHAAEPFSAPAPGQYGENGRPGASVGSPLKSFNASFRAQTADATDAFRRGTVKARGRPRTMSVSTRPTTGTLTSPSHSARRRFVSLGSASYDSSNMARTMLRTQGSTRQDLAQLTVPSTAGAAGTAGAPFGSSIFPSHQAFEDTSPSDILPGAGEAGHRMKASREVQPASGDGLAAAATVTFDTFEEAEVEFRGRMVEEASLHLAVAGNQVASPAKPQGADPPRQSEAMPTNSFDGTSFFSSNQSSTQFVPALSNKLKVDSTSGVFTVRPGCRPASKTRQLLRSLTDKGELSYPTYTAQGPRQSRSIKAGATKAPGPAFYPTAQQHRINSLKKSHNRNPTGKFM